METVKVCCVDPRFGLNIQECGGQWCCEPGGSVTIPLTVYEDMKRRNALGGIKVVGEVAPVPEPEKAAGRPKGGGKKSGPSPFAEDTDPTAPPEPEPEAPAETEPEPQPVEEQ